MFCRMSRRVRLPRHRPSPRMFVRSDFEEGVVDDCSSSIPLISARLWTRFRSYSVSQVLQPHAGAPGQAQPLPGVGGKPAAAPQPAWKRPVHPPVRIDTCIVGDDSTCDAAQHERCRTELGVSSCLCRPGYSRRKHRDPCHSEYTQQAAATSEIGHFPTSPS